MPISCRRTLLAWVLVAGLATPSLAAAASPERQKPDPWVERGHYVVTIGGCNDCHTPGWGENGGKADASVLLTGNSEGFRGPWGTTYPVNLRMYMEKLTEKEWIKTARTLKARPPMPFWVLSRMATGDLRAVYRYIRSLGPGGHAAPDFIPPDKESKPPYWQFVLPQK